MIAANRLGSPHAIALLVRLEADADREASTAPRFSKGQIQPDDVDEGSQQPQAYAIAVDRVRG